jgi:hypothetical protein
MWVVSFMENDQFLIVKPQFAFKTRENHLYLVRSIHFIKGSETTLGVGDDMGALHTTC